MVQRMTTSIIRVTDAGTLDDKESEQLPGSVAFSGHFAGQVQPQTIPVDGAWVFLGPRATVSTSGDQTLFGVAPLGISGGGPIEFGYGMCYQSITGGPIRNFATDSYSAVEPLADCRSRSGRRSESGRCAARDALHAHGREAVRRDACLRRTVRGLTAVGSRHSRPRCAMREERRKGEGGNRKVV
jgi:hypothetical protein